MKKIFLLMMLFLISAVYADVPIRFSYDYEGDRSPDSLHLLVVDTDGDTLADSSWGTGGGSVTTDTVFPGVYGFDITWTEAKYYHTYYFWRQSTTDSGFFVEEGFNETSDSAIVQAAVIAAMNADTTMRLSHLRIDNDSTNREGLYVSSSSGSGVTFASTGGTGIGFRVEGNQSNPSFLARNTGTGPAVQFEVDATATGSGASLYLLNESFATGYSLRMSNNGNNPTVKISNLNDLGTDTSNTGNSEAIYIESNTDSTYTVNIVAAGDSIANFAQYQGAIQTEGEVYMHGRENTDEIGVRIAGGELGTALRIQADSAHAIRVSTADSAMNAIWAYNSNTSAKTGEGGHGVRFNTSTSDGRDFCIGDTNVRAAVMPEAWTAADTGEFQGPAASIDTSQIKTLAQNNPNYFYGPTASGSGSDVVTLYAKDTSTDVYVPQVKMSIFSHVDTTLWAVGYTNISGYYNFNCTAPDTFLVRGELFGYVWPSYDSIFVAATQDDSAMGYVLPAVTAGSNNTCAVRIMVMNNDGTAADNVRVRAYLVGQNITDSTGQAVYNMDISARTNSSGLATINCLWSSYLLMGDSTNIPWHFQIRNGPGVEYVVPRQTADTLSFNQ
jgi:hypothetical protein